MILETTGISLSLLVVLEESTTLAMRALTSTNDYQACTLIGLPKQIVLRIPTISRRLWSYLDLHKKL